MAASAAENKMDEAPLLGRLDSTSGDNGTDASVDADMGRIHLSLGRILARACAAARRVVDRCGDAAAGCTDESRRVVRTYGEDARDANS